MINQELMDEIIYISLKNEFISKNLIERVVLDVISNCDEITQNLFAGLIFGDVGLDFAIAALDGQNQIIANYEEMLEICICDKDQTYLEKNLYILHYLMHEIEHLKEYSKKLKHNYEAEILKYGDSDYIFDRYYLQAIVKFKNGNYIERLVEKKYNLFYEKNWSLIPSERIAEVSSRKNILDSLVAYSKYAAKEFNEYAGINNFYINGVEMGYEKTLNEKYNSPIIEYFKNIGRINDLEKLGFDLERKKLPKETRDLDIMTKMMYGFPIKSSDMNEIQKMKIMTRI